MYETEDADIGVGECPICGQYRKQIDAGELKPCFMWDRKKGGDTDEEE